MITNVYNELNKYLQKEDLNHVSLAKAIKSKNMRISFRDKVPSIHMNYVLIKISYQRLVNTHLYCVMCVCVPASYCTLSSPQISLTTKMAIYMQ